MRRLHITALLAVAACGVELTEPYSAPTYLNVGVGVADTVGVGTAVVSAQLTLNPAIWDEPRAIIDSALSINSQTLSPMPDGEGTALRYAREWVLSVLTSSGTIEVQPPTLAGPDGSYDPIAIAVPLRSGDREIVLPPGDDLVLQLVFPPTSPTPPEESERWRLQLRGSDAVLTIDNHNGPGLANTITVPAEWLEGFAEPFHAELTVHHATYQGERTDPYQVFVSVQSTIRWHVARATP